MPEKLTLISTIGILFCTTQINLLLGAPEVQLPNGIIRGHESKTVENKTYYSFKKIPYAAPPIGELRFRAPVPPSDWTEPIEALSFDVTCYQESANVDMESEDCLYLAVYTPKLPSENESVSLPVMVFIHGGGFVGGSGRVNADRIINEDIIFVAMNYRLGPFGFISTQDEVIPGNNGLKDQHMALKWVRDNINLFGGDPEMITIFGQSAGSASVAYHLLNQESIGLFRGAILESGTFLSPWSFQRNSTEIAFATAAFLNDTFATNRDSKALLEFLQSVDAEDLDTASEMYEKSVSSLQTLEILQGYYWAPVVEVKNPDAFLTKRMYGLLQAGNVVPVPILIGMTSEEAISFNQNPSKVQKNMEAFDANLGWLVPNDMHVVDEAHRVEIGGKIRKIYTGGEPLADNLGAGVRYSSDTSFSRPIIKHAELYSQFVETYFYQFSYDGELNYINASYDGADTVGHNQEKIFIFCSGQHCDVSSYPESDQITVKRMVKIWTNFAKYQNPTPQPDELLQNITWPLVSTEDSDFLYVDINEKLVIKNHPKEATYGKWKEIYEGLGYDDFDTY